ncbi:MAG TPA: hypothetical protein VMD57_04495, partial [Candidatus Baltobacteraceae bacterium]|nr:hypothetical protein [Candidatus Baltobacteraceae bacterium]
TETGHLLMENECGEMKPSYDTAFLEIVDTDAGGIGELVVTTLTNDFIVHGRARDALTTGEGNRVTTWQVDECFAGANSIAHYELRQNANGDCVLRFVPDGTGPAENELRAVVSQLQEKLRLRSEIKTEAMNVLLPKPSGKFSLTCRADAA